MCSARSGFVVVFSYTLQLAFRLHVIVVLIHTCNLQESHQVVKMTNFDLDLNLKAFRIERGNHAFESVGKLK